MSAARYGLVLAPGFAEELKAAPEEVQAAVPEIIGVLTSAPLPGQSALDVRPLEGWLPDSYTTPLIGGHGLLAYQVRQEARIVVLLSLTWF